MDFAQKAYNDSFHYNAIIRNLLETDEYKFLMLQVIWEHYSQAQVTFGLINRTKKVRLADVIDFEELQWQFEYTKNLRFTEKELIWLQGQTVYGQKGIFKPAFIEFLRNFKLSNYRLSKTDDGQIHAEFFGPWVNSSMWEIFAIVIVNTMRYRALMKTMKQWELRVMYTKAEAKLIRKLEKLQKVDDIELVDYSTRRRHSYLWQAHAVELARDMLGDKFTGTSNAYLAMELSLEPKGSTGHEMPMAIAAITTAAWGNSPDFEDRLRDAQYEVPRNYQKTYESSAMHVMLPDTFGTTQFLKYAPKFLDNWKAVRPDSKDPYEAGHELIDWWKFRDQDPTKKMIIFSDSLDVELDENCNGYDMIALHNYFRGKVESTPLGWGTNFGNDFLGCVPGDDPDRFAPISLVCKVISANGRPAVKLSDNFSKRSGDPSEVELYTQFFGTAGMKNAPTKV